MLFYRSYSVAKVLWQNAAKYHKPDHHLYVMHLSYFKRHISIFSKYRSTNCLDSKDNILSLRKKLYSKHTTDEDKKNTTGIDKDKKSTGIEKENGTVIKEATEKKEVKLDNIEEKSLEVAHENIKEKLKQSITNIITTSNIGDKKDGILKNIKEKSLEVASEPASKDEKPKEKEHVLNVKAKIIEAIKEKKTAIEQELSETNKESDAKPEKRRKSLDVSSTSLARNFMTPARAINEFALKQSDLDSIPKTLRRSPHEFEPPITVYWRKDIEAKAIEVWGSKENLARELLKRDIENKRHQQNLFTIKRRLKDFRKEVGKKSQQLIHEREAGLFGRSGKVVITAVVINASNFLFKLFAWAYTGSHSMFSECIHSFADTTNQLILAYGIHKSVQDPNPDHPYGYSNMKYVASLISGVGIFCVGTGLSFYHGFMGLMNPEPMSDFYWAYFILGGSLVSESATWLVAFNSIRKGAREINMPIRDYVLRGQDPSVNVVLMEDLAAVTSIVVAGVCMGLSSHTGSPVPDAIGSLLVGSILGGIASFIIYTNVAALVGRSIPQEHLDQINAELESDVMIRAIHDVKGIDMGNYLVRYKAEMDFDGRELTRSYLDKQDLNELLKEIKNVNTVDDMEAFLLKHGENIVDLMGGEIDRIEIKLKKKHPEVRHCDLEIL